MRARRKCWPQAIFRISGPTRHYVKLEFPDNETCTWNGCGFASSDPTTKGGSYSGTLDKEHLNDCERKIGLAPELAINHSQIREHQKPTEFIGQ